MNDKTNAMIDLFDNNINRLDNLFKRETLLNAFNNYANFDIKPSSREPSTPGVKNHTNETMTTAVKMANVTFPCLTSTLFIF